MEHRHINVKDDEWGVAVIHSIWERGSEDDICALVREVKKNPKAADAVRRFISSSQVYGWPKFFRMFLEKIDEKNDDVYWQQWQKLLEAAASLQGLFPGAVLIGGSAASIHLKHRYSFDADHILTDLREKYEKVVSFITAKK